MPIFDQYKIIFIHIPKTGGTSIEEAFGIRKLVTGYKPNFRIIYGNTDKLELDHLLAKDIRELDKGRWSKYKKIAFVRNPYSRLVSEYHHIINKQKFKALKPFKTFREFVMQLQQIMPKISAIPHIKKSHLIPQWQFVYDGDKMIVDFIGRFENIEKDFANVSDIPLPHSKRFASNKPYNYRDYYDEELRKIVYEIYKEDFVRFNYDFTL